MKASIEKKRKQEFITVMIEEYGGTFQFATRSFEYMQKVLTLLFQLLNTYKFNKKMGDSEVPITSIGVVGIIFRGIPAMGLYVRNYQHQLTPDAPRL